MKRGAAVGKVSGPIVFARPLDGGGGEPRCPKCKYVLLGLTEARCPECGAKFDPGDALTLYPMPRRSVFSPANLRPMPMWIAAISAVATGAYSYLYTPYEDAEGMTKTLYFITASLWIYWLARLLVRISAALIVRVPLRRVVGGWRGFWPLPLFVLALWIAGATSLGLKIRFMISSRALNAAATDIRAGHVPPTPANFGLFHVEQIGLPGDGIRFCIDGTADRRVIWYSRVPQGHHLWGDWYYYGNYTEYCLQRYTIFFPFHN